ncbi:hypothetical protein G6F40_017379 [Rhizopus arrhizus]|nr:hypothetical protein G6F40_017379 [Rhizopus arrhizus]
MASASKWARRASSPDSRHANSSPPIRASTAAGPTVPCATSANEVERKHGNGALPGRAADDARALLEEPSAVAQACQIVGQGFLQQLAMRFFADQLDQRHGQND